MAKEKLGLEERLRGAANAARSVPQGLASRKWTASGRARVDHATGPQNHYPLSERQPLAETAPTRGRRGSYGPEVDDAGRIPRDMTVPEHVELDLGHHCGF